MRRFLLIALVAACGAKSKTDTLPPMPPDPESTRAAAGDDKGSAAKPTPPPPTKPAEDKPPVEARGPIDATIKAPVVTVKLLAPGKGKRATLKVTPKPGSKQAIELALDISQSIEAGADKQADKVPTVVLSADTEVKDVDKDGAASYVVVVTGTDTRDSGASLPKEKLDEFRKALATLKGLTIGATLAANGVAGDQQLHMDAADPIARKMIPVLEIALPTWPVLPKEPIGVGAKWQVVTTTKVSDQFGVTHTTEFELVKHEGATWTIRGKMVVAGDAQKIGDTQVNKVAGTGAIEVALVDGALYPKLDAKLETAIDATAPTGAVKINMTQGTAVTPR